MILPEYTIPNAKRDPFVVIDNRYIIANPSRLLSTPIKSLNALRWFATRIVFIKESTNFKTKKSITYVNSKLIWAL